MKQFLENYYKSISLINIFTFTLKNKYFLGGYILMAVTSFFINTNIEIARDFFLDLNINNISIFNFKFLIVNILISYLTFTKFTATFKILSLLRSFSFFYKEIKNISPSTRSRINKSPNGIQGQGLLPFEAHNIPYRVKGETKNIINIMIFFFILNIFFTFILIFFINNLSSNLNLINLELGNYISNYSNVISIIMVFMFLESFLGREFSINNNPINLSVIILNILLTFGPFIFINYYSYHYPSLYNKGMVLKDYQEILDKIFDLFIVHCESRENLNWNSKLKGTDQITTSVSERSKTALTINNNNTINYPISPSSSNISLNSNFSIENFSSNSSKISLNNTSNATSTVYGLKTRITRSDKELNSSGKDLLSIYLNKLVKILTLKFQGKPEFKENLFQHNGNGSTETVNAYTLVNAPVNLGFNYNDITEIGQISSKSLNEIIHMLSIYKKNRNCSFYDLLNSDIALRNFNNYFLTVKMQQALAKNPFGLEHYTNSESDLPNFCKHYLIDRIMNIGVTTQIIDLILDRTLTPEEKERDKFLMALFTPPKNK